MTLVDSGIAVNDWLSYSFNSHFLTPTDGFSFQVAADILTPKEREALTPGAQVQLSVNGHVQGSGYIDSISYAAERGTGVVWSIEGRDKLSPAVDANADPRVQFKKESTLAQVLAGILGPFGWPDGDMYLTSGNLNVNVLTGQTRGHPTTKGKKAGRPLKNFEEHQLKPHYNEGAFAFAARVAQRHGLWIWLSAEGNQLIVSEPTYDDPARVLYRLQRYFGDSDQPNNVLNGSVRKSVSEQPSAIVADGYSGGGEFGKSKMLVVAKNPTITAPGQDAFVSEWTARGAKVVSFDFQGTKVATKQARPMFLHDDESKTPDELEAFLKREMSLKMRSSLDAHYTVDGHSSNGFIWAVDTTVIVDDEVADINEPLWILSRTFHKSRTGGTTTDLELIRPHTLDF